MISVIFILGVKSRHVFLCFLMYMLCLYLVFPEFPSLLPAYFMPVINPRHACAARVAVLSSCVCVCESIRYIGFIVSIAFKSYGVKSK